MKFDRRMGSTAAEVPVKFQSDRKIIHTNLAASRLCEILWWDILSDIETGPWSPLEQTVHTHWIPIAQSYVSSGPQHIHHDTGCTPVQAYSLISQLELGQLERLRSEDTPPRPHDYPHYWVKLDPKSKEDNVKFTNLKNLPKFHNTPSKVAWSDVQIWNGSDKYWWRYRADTILSADGWTDGQTNGRHETSIPPFQLHWSGGYNNYNVWLTDSPLDKMVTKLLRVILSAIWSVKIG